MNAQYSHALATPRVSRQCQDYGMADVAGEDAQRERDALGSIIDDMMADWRIVSDYTADRYNKSMDILLATLLSDGLPLGNKTERDDALHDKLTTSLDSMRDDFRQWAEPRAMARLNVMREQARDE